MIDLLALIPFYVTLILDQMDDVKMIGKTGKIIRLVRVLRIMRIFKLVRHFAGLQSLAYTMQEAYKELGLLLLIVSFAAFIFAILVYFNEKDNMDLFDTMLWSVMTISTVGSDAAQPSSTFGTFFGGICPIIGVFILSLPVPIVVNSFVTCYRNRIWRTEVRQKKEERMSQRRKSDILHIQQNFVKNLISVQRNLVQTNPVQTDVL